MSSLFKIPGGIILIASQLIAGLMSLGLIVDNFGSIVAFLAVSFAPATLIFVPIYDGFWNSNWSILAIGFGGFFTGGLLCFIGERIDGKI